MDCKKCADTRDRIANILQDMDGDRFEKDFYIRKALIIMGICHNWNPEEHNHYAE